MEQKRIKLSFSKQEIRSSLKLGYSGISTPLVSDLQAKKDFKVGNILDSFGLFGGNGDPNKFYPNLDVPKDILPKSEDFIRVPFRLLSATIVGAGSWKATDFSDENILKSSLKRLNSKPVFTEHDQAMLNWVGVIEGTSWDVSKGDIPAGINGLLAIDAKTNPKIARGVLIGAIFSNSVTVEFDWIPSHSFSDSTEFDSRVGAIHPDDNKMIRRIATKIHDYHETSLVWLGADPYAKLLDDKGDLVNIDKASTYKLEKEKVKNEYKEKNSYFIPLSLDKNIISLSKSDTISNNLKNNKKMEKQIELTLKKLLDLKDNDTLTLEHLSNLEVSNPKLKLKSDTFDKLMLLNDNGDEIEKESDIKTQDFALIEKSKIQEFIASKKESEELTATINEKLEVNEDEDVLEKIEKLSEFSKIGKQSLEDKRNECKRLYGLSVNNKTDEVIIELIDEASPKRLKALVIQYSKEAVGKFTGTCNSCGSNEVDFKSSQIGDDDKLHTQDVGVDSFHDILDKYDNPSMIATKS